ncbi:MAG: PEGA domain-containing protein [Myxococcota bacterium]
MRRDRAEELGELAPGSPKELFPTPPPVTPRVEPGLTPSLSSDVTRAAFLIALVGLLTFAGTSSDAAKLIHGDNESAPTVALSQPHEPKTTLVITGTTQPREVWVDGERIWVTLPAQLELHPGPHQVTFHGAESKVAHIVHLVRNESTHLRFDEAPAPPDTDDRVGRLTILSRPTALVYLNEEKLGRTPIPPLDLAPGTYQLMFYKPGHARAYADVTVRAGEEVHVEEALGRLRSPTDFGSGAYGANPSLR